MRPMLAALAVVTTATMACAKADSTAPPRTPAEQEVAKEVAPPGGQAQTAAEEAAFGDFTQRVQAYLDLHNRVAARAPKLPTEATPEQIHQHQLALARLIQAERAGARPGDVFTPEAEKSIKAMLARIFGGAKGKQLKSSIMDENPVGVRHKVAVNSRYPDEVPMSTVPPQVLASLPKLPKELEYRFIDDRLILLDVRAHLIVDYIDNALP